MLVRKAHLTFARRVTNQMPFNKFEVLCGVLLCVGLALLPPIQVWPTQF